MLEKVETLVESTKLRCNRLRKVGSCSLYYTCHEVELVRLSSVVLGLEVDLIVRSVSSQFELDQWPFQLDLLQA